MNRQILDSTGMTKEQIACYAHLEEQLLPRLELLVQAYWSGEYEQISQVYEPMCQLCPTEEELLAAELVFVLRCAQLKAQSLSGKERALFLDALSDIGYKVKECLAYKKTVGIFVLNWYHGLLKARRLSLGRLQFAIRHQGEKECRIGSLLIKPGEPMLVCHIPSAGPLTQEACFDAYRRAWEEFPEHRRNGVLPIFCTSWLFYPGLEQVFPENTNVGKFRRNFTMYDTFEVEGFPDCWRVFSMDLPEDLSLLPCDTRMQQRFAQYIRQGGTFGITAGVLLFDGKQIVR